MAYLYTYMEWWYLICMVNVGNNNNRHGSYNIKMDGWAMKAVWWWKFTSTIVDAANLHFSTCADGARFVFAACQPMPVPDRTAPLRGCFLVDRKQGGKLHADFWPTYLILATFWRARCQKKGAAVRKCFDWRVDFQVEAFASLKTPCWCRIFMKLLVRCKRSIYCLSAISITGCT